MNTCAVLAILGLLMLASPAGAEAAELAPVGIPVLVYHSIFPDHPGQTEDQRAYGITPDQLDAQLSMISQNGYTAITFDQAAAALREGTTTKKLIAITFDDGWWNQYAYALPLLQKHAMVATFFIYPNPIGKSALFMDWNQVREVAAAGMSIGSHSLTHPYFSLLSQEGLEKEIVQSKTILEAELQTPVTVFAPPYGYMSADIEQLIKDSGYGSARTLGKPQYGSTTDPYDIKGFVVTRDMARFERMVPNVP